MRLIRCSALFLFGLLCGCQTLVPLQTDVTPTPGRVIVVEFEEPIEFQIVGARLQDLVRTQGTFMTNDADSLIVQADHLWSAHGAKHDALRARIAIPRGNIARIQEQRISAWRSALVAGAGVAALGLVVLSVEKVGGGDQGGGPPPPDPK